MERSEYSYRDASLEERRRHSNSGRRQKVHGHSVRYTRQYDFALLFLTIGIALFGVIMIYSAGYYTAALKNNPLRYVKSQRTFCIFWHLSCRRLCCLQAQS